MFLRRNLEAPTANAWCILENQQMLIEPNRQKGDQRSPSVSILANSLFPSCGAKTVGA